MLHLRDITAFVHRNPLFSYPTPISAKISGCYSWSRPVMLGSAEREHLRLTDRETIFERIPTYVITIHQRHRRTDRRTDDM